MNPAFWIAISAAALVVLAHIALFWWFICKPVRNKKQSVDSTPPDER